MWFIIALVLLISLVSSLVIGHTLHTTFDRYTIVERRTHCYRCGSKHYPLLASRVCTACEREAHEDVLRELVVGDGLETPW